MEFDIKIFLKELDSVLGLTGTLKAAFEDESEKISTNDIKEVLDIIENKITDIINYTKNTK